MKERENALRMFCLRGARSGSVRANTHPHRERKDAPEREARDPRDHAACTKVDCGAVPCGLGRARGGNS